MQKVIEESVVPYLNQVKIPTASSNVHKEECCFSFTTPESEDGLFIDLNSFLAFSKEYAKLNFQKTGQRLYLNIKRTYKVIVPTEEEKAKAAEEPPKKKPLVMGIGMEGGFQVDEEKKWQAEDLFSLVVLPEFHVIPFPNQALPDKVLLSITAIINANSAEKKKQVNEWKAEIRESKYARTLKQLDNGVKVLPKGWKCQNCDLTENLWMNLTDGTILCGRKNFDGSGGNGHALEHFQKTAFPLCVKLGTISADSVADVFSYAEDDAVTDPLLPQHLAHFGIKISQMEKTEKSIAEMEIDLNSQYDFSRIQEKDKELEPIYGPGYTGLQNLGNSCYMASMMQTLFSLPEFHERYFVNAENVFKDVSPNPTEDIHVQLCKLAKGILSGQYSQPPKEVKENERAPSSGVAPRMFKYVIGKGHYEFATMNQQDVVDFFQHLLSTIKKDEHKRSGGKFDLSKIFEFETEERTQCSSSGKVQYVKGMNNVLSLPIPLDKATNKEEVKVYEAEQIERLRLKKEGITSPETTAKVEPVRPRISLLACLQSYCEPQEIPGFFSTAINARTIGIRTNRLATFPKYLVFQLCKFTQAEDWTPRKLDIHLEVPDTLDLEWMRGHGLQKNEELLPQDKPESKEAKIEINEEFVGQLMNMGFPRERCVKAVYHTKNTGAESAMNWIMEHMDDADIDVPLKLESSKSAESAVNEEAIGMIISMGFSRAKAIKALKATNNDLERASDWIFSHMDDDTMEVDEPKKEEKTEDGPAKYQLKAFISHMGTSTGSGHYVCHIKKEGKWILFNDNKVAISSDPPKDVGYLYLYERRS